jgi:hypothetical protein
MKKTLLVILLAIVSVATLSAQTTRERIMADPSLAAGVYRPYPTPTVAQTPAPKGYEPFYISHYGRHGSRFIEFNSEFDMVMEIFARAKEQGKLTPFGDETYAKLLDVSKICQGRAGDLAPLGVRQNEQIAERMVAAHPELFRARPEVRAVSTTVPRCLLSMNAFTNALIRLAPDVEIALLDTGGPYMPYLNPLSGVRTTPLAKRVDLCRWPDAEWVKEWDVWRDSFIDNSRLLGALFAEEFVPTIEDAPLFAMHLFRNIASFGGTPAADVDFSKVFTPEERYRWWRAINVRYYIERGNSGIGGGFLSEIADPLLYNFLQEAVERVANPRPAVSLRFGHDGCIMCMLCAMGITGWSKRVDSWERVEDEASCDFTIPMSSNFQWIFYRHRKSGDVLVKMMLNEEELELPLPSDHAPYYRWADVKQWCIASLADTTLYKFDLERLK